MRLARFIADLEPRFRKDVLFRFVARFDCRHDYEAEKYVSQRFYSALIDTHTQWTDWPAGPNAMVKDILAYETRISGECGVGVDGILLIEPDCVPVARDWLDQLIAAWKRARQDGKWIMGAWAPSGGAYGHINGNCIVSPELPLKVNFNEVINQELAWDCGIFAVDAVRAHAQRTSLIKNLFRYMHATEEHLTEPDPANGTERPVLIHGVKSDHAWKWAEKVLQP